MKPSIGRIVHFVVEKNGIPVAAIITRVWSDTSVNLKLFADGIHSNWEASVKYEEYSEMGNNPQTWHWPPKV